MEKDYCIQCDCESNDLNIGGVCPECMSEFDDYQIDWEAL